MNRKPVLITAAAGGLGKAFASECAARSWDLVLVDINRSALPPLASGLRRMFNIGVQTVTCDLTNPDERAMLWKQVKDRAGNLRGLINVAGLEFEGMFRERSLEEVRAILRLNVEATLENCLQGQALLSANEDAFIINTSSLAAVYPMPLKAVYAATKRLVYHFTLALHHELKKDRIHALALIPAGLPTHRASLQRIQSQGLLGTASIFPVSSTAGSTGFPLSFPMIWQRRSFSVDFQPPGKNDAVKT